ncbi:MAG TPA: hypothetical protein VL588_06715, partial [Bdellovibrionota bacterium]|nr:hypothetical protein [Bdellovibrionota bacterium]
MRIAASLILVFHLLVVALVPNQHLYVHRASAGILLPYANLLGINTAWRYFAPDPAPPVYYEFDVTRPAAPGTGALRHEKV